MPSVKLSCNAIPVNQTGVELQKLLGGMQKDIAAIAASLNQLITDYNANTNIVDDTTAAAVVPVTTE